MTYHSEYGQDRWLVENVFGDARNGTFVEAGALDGIFHSNTLHFEREKGWRGVLVEPIPALFEAVKINRPLAKVFGCALSDHEGTEILEVAGATPGWSGFSRIEHPRRAATYLNNHVIVDVCPLGDLLHEVEISGVDYLSLDVEGAELEILAAYPFDEIPIRLIGVEDNDANNEPLRELLRSHGYRHLARVGVDEFWSLT